MMAPNLERINRFVDGIHRPKRRLISPEGVALDVDIATHGERLTAFVIDFVFWQVATILLYMGLVALVLEHVSLSVGTTIILFLAFLLRNLYFIHFELVAQGATPGKRIVGLKVIDRNGGPLLPAAVVTRNLTREIEVFLPLSLFAQLGAAGRGFNFWTEATYLGWVVLVSCLPFFNRDHLRAGDLIAGTMVISVSRRVLLGDLVEAVAPYRFTRKQLEAYGAFELQVLEELLRRPAAIETTAVLREVTTKVCNRIGWSDPVPLDNARAFLQAFYTAERGHLEREQLFGKFRADKTAQVTRGEEDGVGG
jgi:uncharacterized RDD family membrane protein YckC